MPNENPQSPATPTAGGPAPTQQAPAPTPAPNPNPQEPAPPAPGTEWKWSKDDALAVIKGVQKLSEKVDKISPATPAPTTPQTPADANAALSAQVIELQRTVMVTGIIADYGIKAGPDRDTLEALAKSGVPAEQLRGLAQRFASPTTPSTPAPGSSAAPAAPTTAPVPQPPRPAPSLPAPSAPSRAGVPDNPYQVDPETWKGMKPEEREEHRKKFAAANGKQAPWATR